MMTHDELLDKIYWHWKNAADAEFYGLSGYRKALRAVVKLHRPIQDSSGWWHCNECDHIGDFGCPTFQAIEKELGL
jgi:hypothetical protein